MKVPFYLIPLAFYVGFVCRHFITARRSWIRKLISPKGHF